MPKKLAKTAFFYHFCFPLFSENAFIKRTIYLSICILKTNMRYDTMKIDKTFTCRPISETDQTTVNVARGYGNT